MSIRATDAERLELDNMLSRLSSRKTRPTPGRVPKSELCRKCGAPIIWTETHSLAALAINQDSYQERTDEKYWRVNRPLFENEIHTPHSYTCTGKKK